MFSGILRSASGHHLSCDISWYRGVIPTREHYGPRCQGLLGPWGTPGDPFFCGGATARRGHKQERTILAVVMTTTRGHGSWGRLQGHGALRPWGSERSSRWSLGTRSWVSWMMMAALVCGGTGLVEHPSCPRKESSASIWRTVLLQVFQALDDFEILDVPKHGIWSAQ